jgi:hypothetical protein
VGGNHQQHRQTTASQGSSHQNAIYVTKMMFCDSDWLQFSQVLVVITSCLRPIACDAVQCDINRNVRFEHWLKML